MHRAIHVPLFRPAVLLLAMSLVLTYSPGCRPKDQPVAVLKVAVSLTQVAEGTVLPGVGEQILPGQESRVSVPEVVLDFRFTEPVVPDSISAALRLNPSVQHQISWPSPDMMQLRLSALPLGIPVSVTLGQEVRAVSGSTVPSPLTYRVVRQNPPAISATVEGQPELIAPGRYKVLAGKKTIRLDFDRPMDRTRVETSLLGQLPASCLPTLRWESDSVAYLDLDLALNTSVHLSFRGWPDRQGILSVGPGDMTLVAVSTVRLLAGISPQNPTQLSTLLDQFSAGFVAPDGKSIAFTERFPVDEASEVVVWTLTLADKTIRRLGSYTDTGSFRLGWMPDSRHLAINAGPEIRLVATSPTARPGQGSTQTASRTLVSLEDRTFVGMSIGPRSGRIAAFAPTNGEEGAAVDLLLIEPDGANVKNHPAVSHLFSRESYWIPVASAWSPDESQLAFCDVRSRQEQVLALIDPVTGGTRELGGRAEQLAWSPTGHLLAAQNPDGSWDIVDTQTGRRQPAGTGEPMDTAFWSPDGKHMLFGGSGTIVLWDVEGQKVVWTTPGIPLGWSGERVLWLTP